MSSPPRRRALATASVLAVLALSACATAPASPAPTSTSAGPRLDEVRPALPEGPVVGAGMVIDSGGAPQLCLGAIMESYPPQCDGLPLDAWSWEGLDGSETSGTATWGQYAVQGTFDGERLAVSEPPVMLALYDPAAADDPTGGVDGRTPEAELLRVQDDIAARLGDTRGLGVLTQRGYVWVQVVWDDGSLQDAVDAEYGDDVVIVSSALREIG